MKILWFTNTPCSAAEKLSPNQVAGGWLTALEGELVQNEDVELNICFYWGQKNIKSFTHNKTRFHPVSRQNSKNKLGRFISRAMHKTYDNKKDVTKLLSIIDMVKPDLIHIHGTEENFGLIQSHTKIPVVISIQGILSPYTEKFFSGIPEKIAYKYEGLKPKLKFTSFNFAYNDFKKRAKREREILSQSQYILGRTDWDKRITGVLAKNRKYYIGNEMLRPIFYEKKWTKKQFGKPLQIVTTTSGGLYKGLETIVKTCRILKISGHLEFSWTIIGLSEYSSIAKTVKKWLKINYANLNIQLVGKKQEDEVTEILIQSDIYCQVSHIENSPNSVCEAMLLGMPIIASFAGGTDSMLENGKEGILIQDGDPYSLAGSIYQLSQNFDKAKSLAATASIRASIRHNKQKIVNELLDVYSQLKNEHN